MHKKLDKKVSEIIIMVLIYFIALCVLLYPYTKYYTWGSDTGEYYWILNYFSQNHKMPLNYYGWALVYHFMYTFFATLSPLVQIGLEPLFVLKHVEPILVAMSSVIMYVLIRRIGGSPLSSFLGSLAYSLAIPRVFPVSHPMPGALAELFLIFLYLLHLEAYRNKSLLYVELFLASLPFALAHHLTQFVFIASIGTLSLFHRLYGFEEKSVNDFLVFSVSYFSFVFYWFSVPQFEQIIRDALKLGRQEIILLSIILFVVYALIVMVLPPKIKFRRVYPKPDYKKIMTYFAIYLAIVGIFSVVSIYIGVPGTDIKIRPTTLLFLLPTLIIGFSAYVGWLKIKSKEESIPIISWILAIAFLALYGTVTKSTVFIPYRYAQYIWTPTSILLGLGLGEILVKTIRIIEIRPHLKKYKEYVLGSICALLAISLILTAYPPQEALGGFEEGTTWKTFEGILWMRDHLPRSVTIASDHRLSSLVFGFTGINATWDTGARILLSEDLNETLEMMKFFETPSGYKRIDYVVFDIDTIKGVAGVQWENAEPMSDKALMKFKTKYFEEVYNNGYIFVYRVKWEVIESET